MTMNVDPDKLIAAAAEQGVSDATGARGPRHPKRTPASVWAQAIYRAYPTKSLGSRKKTAEVTAQLTSAQKRAVLHAYGVAYNRTAR